MKVKKTETICKKVMGAISHAKPIFGYPASYTLINAGMGVTFGVIGRTYFEPAPALPLVMDFTQGNMHPATFIPYLSYTLGVAAVNIDRLTTLGEYIARYI